MNVLALALTCSLSLSVFGRIIFNKVEKKIDQLQHYNHWFKNVLLSGGKGYEEARDNKQRITEAIDRSATRIAWAAFFIAIGTIIGDITLVIVLIILFVKWIIGG